MGVAISDPTFINVGCIAIDDGTRALESRLLEQDELIVREQQLHSAREEISQALYEENWLDLFAVE